MPFLRMRGKNTAKINKAFFHLPVSVRLYEIDVGDDKLRTGSRNNFAFLRMCIEKTSQHGSKRFSIVEIFYFYQRCFYDGNKVV